jgi:hypothetical protein
MNRQSSKVGLQTTMPLNELMNKYMELGSFEIIASRVVEFNRLVLDLCSRNPDWPTDLKKIEEYSKLNKIRNKYVLCVTGVPRNSGVLGAWRIESIQPSPDTVRETMRVSCIMIPKKQDEKKETIQV